jgi:hypothetical protein
MVRDVRFVLVSSHGGDTHVLEILAFVGCKGGDKEIRDSERAVREKLETAREQKRDVGESRETRE